MTEKMYLNFFIFAMIGYIVLVPVSSTTTHIVGDHMGWSMPKYPGFYNDWAKSKTFAVGDVLGMSCPLKILLPFSVDLEIMTVMIKIFNNLNIFK